MEIILNKCQYVDEMFWFIPCVSLWYDKNVFQKDIKIPGFGFNFSFLKWSYRFIIIKKTIKNG